MFALLVPGLWLLVGDARAEEPTTSLSYPTARYPAAPVSLLSPADASKLRVLGNDLNVLAELSETRLLDGSLSVAAGCAFVAIGLFIDDALVRTLLATTGAIAATRGVIALAAVPDGVDQARTFAALPVTTASEVAARLSFGEEALRSLASRTRRARLLDGSLSIAAGAAFTPVYFGLRRREEPDYRFADDPSDFIGVAVSLISVATGVFTLVRKSEAEKRHAAYTRFKQAQARHARSLSPVLTVHIAREGLQVGAQGRF
jgi:hypothetical protein